MFTIEFATDNAAFEQDPRDEIARILGELTYRIQYEGVTEGKIRDNNGNTVGTFTLTSD